MHNMIIKMEGGVANLMFGIIRSNISILFIEAKHKYGDDLKILKKYFQTNTLVKLYNIYKKN